MITTLSLFANLFLVDHSPNPTEVERWKTHAKTGAQWKITMDDDSPYSMRALQDLCREVGDGKIDVQVPEYPLMPEKWQPLVSCIHIFEVKPETLPTRYEISTLNSLQFHSSKIWVKGYPSSPDMEVIATLKAPSQVVFEVGRYPLAEDQEKLELLPTSLTLIFHADYWPQIGHLNVLNALPHSKSLEVHDIHPASGTLETISRIDRLTSLVYESNFELTGSSWDSLGRLPRVWITRNFIPSEASLETYGEGALRVAPERELSASETRRLKSARLSSITIARSPE